LVGASSPASARCWLPALRLFSGRLADRTRAYWTITALGYTLTLVAVPLLAFAGNGNWRRCW